MYQQIIYEKYFGESKCMCQRQLRGWLIGAWDGKSWDQFGIQYILSQFYPGLKGATRFQIHTKTVITAG